MTEIDQNPNPLEGGRLRIVMEEVHACRSSVLGRVSNALCYYASDGNSSRHHIVLGCLSACSLDRRKQRASRVAIRESTGAPSAEVHMRREASAIAIPISPTHFMCH